MKNTHQIASDKGKTPTKPTITSKPKRILDVSPLRKYVVYRDPYQWDDDITTGGSEK